MRINWCALMRHDARVSAPSRSRPFTLRLSANLDRHIAAIASRTGRSKAAVVESLADEANRCRRYPGIAFRGQEWDRDAWIPSAGLDVWQVIRGLQDFGNGVERMAQETDLTEAQIRLAAAYYHEYQAEIDHAIAADRRTVEELRQEYPFARVLIVDA